MVAAHGQGTQAVTGKRSPQGVRREETIHRNFKRRVELFALLNSRRGPGCETKGALTLRQRLPVQACEATRCIDWNSVDPPDGFQFQVILMELDRLYRYDYQVEGPLQCEEYFEKFPQLSLETLQEYELRERDVRERLRDVGSVIPDEVSGWVALSRDANSAVPGSGRPPLVRWEVVRREGLSSP